MKILNSVSLNMLADNAVGFKIIDRLTSIEQDVGYNANGLDLMHFGFASSFIGHQDLVNLVNAKFGIGLVANRATVALNKGEKALVIQYKGERLPEGSKTLPQGATLDFLIVEVM
jgi:hypothetical protein